MVQTIVAGQTEDRAMAKTRNSDMDPDRRLNFQIKIKGRLGPDWAD
jgi:hypothetical protein